MRKMIIRFKVVIIAVTILLCCYGSGRFPVFYRNPHVTVIANINANDLIDFTTYDSHQSNGTFWCIPTKTLRPFIICPYRATDDIYISKALLTRGIWEPKLTNYLYGVLHNPANITFLDVGANIGYFTQLAASLGISVVAIEPLEKNVHRLLKATLENGFQDRVTLLQHTVSNTRTNVALGLSGDNQGGAAILTGRELWTSRRTQQARSILIDDIAEYIKTTEVVIKIDIEGHECLALEQCEKLLQHRHVIVIITEWKKMMSQRHKHGVACPAKKILQTSKYLKQYEFTPFDLQSGMALDIRDSMQWGYEDIVWKHSSIINR